MILHSQNNL